MLCGDVDVMYGCVHYSKGSSKWVHRTCLDQWRSTSEDRAFSKCTECLTPYRMISPPDLEDANVTFWRNIWFSWYCARDISIVLIIVHIFIFFCSSLVYYGDKQKHILIHLIHLDNFPKTFYYLCGLLVFFACVGFCFLIGVLTNSAQTRHPGLCDCRDPTSPHCCMCCDVGPYHPRCYYCPTHCCEGGACCEGCTACECSSCECGSCHACDAGGAACEGEGALVFGLIVVCILAAIGIFICAALGIKGVKEISERHVHVLRKRTLINDFIVSDLAADGNDSFVDLEMGPIGGDVLYGRVSTGGVDEFESNSAISQEQSDGLHYFSEQQQRTLDRMGLI